MFTQEPEGLLDVTMAGKALIKTLLNSYQLFLLKTHILNTGEYQIA
jgi:hypothetical protein